MTDVGIGLQLGALTYTLSAFDGETAAPLATLPAESIGPPGIRRLFEYGCQTDSDGVWQKLDTFFQWPRLDITGSFPKALQVRVDGAFHTPEALCVDLLRRLKAEAERHIAPGDRVNRCAIGIPDDATPAYQDFIRKNAQAAGFHWVELVPELESSALALLQACVITGKYVALCDIGETSTQVAVVRVLDRQNLTFEILASGSLPELGAWQLDTFLIEHIMADLDREQQIALAAQGVALRRKPAEARRNCVAISQGISFDPGSGLPNRLSAQLLKHSLSNYEEAIAALLWQTLPKAKIYNSQIEQVVLLGNLTRILDLRQTFSEYFHNKIEVLAFADSYVASGCALYLEHTLLSAMPNSPDIRYSTAHRFQRSSFYSINDSTARSRTLTHKGWGR